MAGSISGTTLAVIGATMVAAGSAAYSGYSMSEQADEQKNASEQVKKNAEKAAAAQDEATNKANQKSPDSNAILAAAQQAAKAGSGSTMLTSPQGVGQDKMSLGKTSLLGG